MRREARKARVMKPPLPSQRKNKASDEPSIAPLREGFLVADKYGLIEPLGTGSMGSVWKASHVLLGHMVAIKFLHASIEAYPEGRIRFEREAKLSARLGETSRHICRVSDFGVIGSGTPFVVMELLQGEELSARLKRERQLPLPLIVEIVGQLCRALTVAHEGGVVHRDLKPANVFLCKAEEGEEILVKLLDFGVAKAALEHEDTQATRAGTIFGTPGYMSPEQIVADTELDPRSDLWSVAVMAYRMAVGRTPFGSGSLGELGLRILSTNPPAPSSLRPDLPLSFDEWMKKGLSKRREDRFASAAELANALVQATGTRAWGASSPHATAVAELVEGIEETSQEPTQHADVSSSGPQRRWRRLLPALGAALGLVAAATLLATRSGGKDEAAEHDATVRPRPPQAAGQRAAEAPVEEQMPAAQVAPAAPISSAVAEAGQAANELALPDAAAAASAAPAKRPNPTKSAVSSSVMKRAGELWNKKDEL